jgi:hypothetical protein
MKTKVRKKRRPPSSTNVQMHNAAPTPAAPTSLMERALYEFVHWEFYDRVRLVIPPPTITENGDAPSATFAPPRKAHFFVRPLGMDGKTLADTNIVLCGQLPNPQQFRLQSLWLDILENGRPVDADCRLWWHSAFSFDYLGKSYLQRPAHTFLRREAAYFSGPLTIEPGTHFSATFESAWRYDPTRKFEVALTIAGQLRRSVI